MEHVNSMQSDLETDKNKVEKKLEVIESVLIKYLTKFVFFLLAAMSLTIVYSVITRYFFSSPSGYAEELLRYSLVWLGLIGAALCCSGNKHLSLPILFDKCTPRTQRWFTMFNAALIISFGVLMSIGGFDAVIKNQGLITPMLKVAMGTLQLAVPLCGVLIVVTRVLYVIRTLGWNRETLIEAGTIFSGLVALFYSFTFFQSTETYEFLVSEYLELSSTIVLFSIFFILLVMNTPIAIGLAFSGIVTLSLQLDFESLPAVIGEKMFSGLDSFGFLALPFFILAGNIMNQGGIARRLLDMAILVGRRVPGNLWQANVIANMLFGSLSGSAIAASTAIGGIVSPMAKEKGYDEAYTTAINAASAPTGMLIPPTGVFIMYSLITGGSASIAALFLAGYIPGLIMGLCVMVAAYFYAVRKNYPTDKSPYNLSETAIVLGRALPSLSLIFIVIGGIIGGVFTATEGSGIAVLYSIILGVFYRSLNLKKMVTILSESATMSAVILFLIACSGLMSWAMTFANIPEIIGELLLSASDNKYIIFLLINITLLIVGIFMDMTPAMLIFTPIFYPIVTSLGMSPVQFGVMMTYNLAIGIVTPPVGTVLFVSCSITNQKVMDVVKPLLPIFAMQIIGLLLITYFPFFTMFIPSLFGM